MSQHTHAPQTSGQQRHDSAGDLRVETVFDLLSDEYVRHVLASLQAGPKTAPAIAEDYSASRATIYRRLNRLRDLGVVAERQKQCADGHQRSEFRLTLDRVDVALDDAGFTSDVTRD